MESGRERLALAFSVFLGGAAAGAAEGFVEAREGVEAGGHGDVEDLVFCGDEKALGVGDAVVGDVVNEGGAEGFFEEVHGVVWVEVDGFADGVGGEGFEVALGDEAGHSFHFVEAAIEEGVGFVFGGSLRAWLHFFNEKSHSSQAGFELE